MSRSRGRVLIGITGSIAAFKIAEVTSALVKSGIDVQVIMTASAVHFIGGDTFSVLTGKRVYKDLFSPFDEGKIVHVELSREYDLFLIAPASANTISKIANGIADNLLTTTCLGFPPNNVIFAPAMNTRMYENPIIQENIKKLKKLGYRFIEPDSGILACREVGKGRLASWEEIVEYIKTLLYKSKDFMGKKALITAGPTREPIDPVRFITNHSSGKMGYAIAKALRDRGADVMLITGPTHLIPPGDIKVLQVETAIEMHRAVMDMVKDVDIFISAAAVSDFRPRDFSKEKIKKGESSDLLIHLKKNPDILKEVSRIKKSDQIIVGFAAETEDLFENAKKKIEEKQLDFIVANKIGDKGAGFEVDTNRVTIIEKDGNLYRYPLLPKDEVAHIILTHILKILK